MQNHLLYKLEEPASGVNYFDKKKIYFKVKWK